jgi:hypothetical protein
MTGGTPGKLVSSVALALLVAFSAPATASTIHYDAVNQPDSGGGDLWQYQYSLSGFVFNSGEGFSIYFDPARYQSLTPVSSPTGWTVGTTDPSMPLFGTYTATATSSGAPLGNFVLDFVWLGAPDETPGSQPFSVSGGGYGFTIGGGEDEGDDGLGGNRLAQIPEPATLLLFAAGITMAAVRRQRRRA